MYSSTIDGSVGSRLDGGWEVASFNTSCFSPRKRDYCIVIPVINEGERIRNLLQRMRTLSIADVVDIVIVDGGSTDGSLEHSFLRKANVRTLLIKSGPGKLSAQLRCAYAYSLREGYDGIITIDGNDKDDPEAIPRFVEELRQGVDFVQASRFLAHGSGENTPRLREIAIRWIHAPLLSWASKCRWTDTTQGFRGYSRRLLLDPKVQPFRDVFGGYELLAYLSYRAPRCGFICKEIGTIRRYPVEGKAPTKISAVRGNVGLLKVLCYACLGVYNPVAHARVSLEERRAA